MHSARIRPAMFAAICIAAPAQAQNLVFGNSATPVSIDPHYQTATPNVEVSKQIFDALTRTEADGHVAPSLAESWRLADPQTWEFKLQPGVRFQNGAPFTADDVAFTLERAANVPNSPGGFGIFTRSIVGVDIVDPQTVRLRTLSTDPFVPVNLSWVMMLSRAIHTGVTTAQFNDGSKAIGTGAYRLVSYTPGQSIELARNDAYWGPKPAWEHVTNRMITANGARTAALLSGDVDIVNGVPPADQLRLRADKRLVLRDTAGLRIVYLALDSARERSPFVTGPNGEALDHNPLRDPRVRRALSLAINRAAIADRVLLGAALPTVQVVREGLVGYDPSLKPEFDPTRARALLAEAGYPAGFGITLHGPNDRYLNDSEVIQAVGQMWTRIGVKTAVEPMPFSTMATRASHQAFSALLFGGTAATNDATFPLRSIIATYDPARGYGASNNTRYSNPAFDSALDAAMHLHDDGARGAQLRQAMEIAAADTAIVPLYIQKVTWAMRANLDYTPRVDEETHVAEVSPR